MEPKWQCKVCLKHCSAGVIYCTCGHLMTKDSAENRKYISAVLDTFSIPNFYIRKNRPHGHRYGKAPGCKEYYTANQLARRCRKKKYDSIHDRYIRDKTFRKAMIQREPKQSRPSNCRSLWPLQVPCHVVTAVTCRVTPETTSPRPLSQKRRPAREEAWFTLFVHSTAFFPQEVQMNTDVHFLGHRPSA